MGTIVIVEYANIGAPHARTVTIPDLSKQTALTTDATTSTTVESITLQNNTVAVKCYANELHRVSVVDSTCATTFDYVPADSTRVQSADFGVTGGQTLYYRSDA